MVQINKYERWLKDGVIQIAQEMVKNMSKKFLAY